MQMDYQARIDALRKAAGLDSGKVDAVAIVPGSNMKYFTGLDFHLSERPTIVLLTANDFSIIVPQLEMPKLISRPDLEARPFQWTDEAGYLGAFEQAIRELGLHGKRIGIDGMTMRVTEWLTFTQIDPTLQVSAIEREMIAIRSHKMADEIAAMRRAIEISETALDRLLAEVKVGMTEAQIAGRLTQIMMELGATGLAFDLLVQTGENSSNPHGATTDRALQAGEFLLIDYGAKFGDYPADITRTFLIGEPTAEQQKIYDTVLAANEAAKAIVAPGVKMGDIDKAARDVINAAGYGEYFTHRTGHGLGLDTHEPIPQIAAGVEDVLEAGMVFTIEPGIYLPKVGGVRIEDNILVTETGKEVLTSYKRELKF